MLIAAAVCPHPPILVPELAGGAAGELDGLRAACDDAVARLTATLTADPGGVAGGQSVLVVVGADQVTGVYGADSPGTLEPYGLDLRIGGSVVAPGPPLPLSLTMGKWLLARSPTRADNFDVRYQAVAGGAAPAECAALGRLVAASAARVALLVMGDGSARRSVQAPGYLDERAAPYDAEVARALGVADAGALARLDPVLSGELVVAGRAAWQVLAGAAGKDPFRAELLADEAPYGVGYHVAIWTGRGTAHTTP